MAVLGNGQFAGILFRGVLRFPVRFGCSHLSPSLSQNPSVKCGQSSHLDMLRNLAEPAATGQRPDLVLFFMDWSPLSGVSDLECYGDKRAIPFGIGSPSVYMGTSTVPILRTAHAM